AERASRLGRHGDPRAGRPAGARRPGCAARGAPPVALHDRADAALRGRHQRDPARHHRAARARAAAEVAMQLAPTEEQEAIRQAARRFLAAEITRERRLAWDRTAEGHDPAFWEAVARLGWFGYGLPAAYGGQGASLLDLGLLVEELGRAAAPFGVFAAIAGGPGPPAPSLSRAGAGGAWRPGSSRPTGPGVGAGRRRPSARTGRASWGCRAGHRRGARPRAVPGAPGRASPRCARSSPRSSAPT